MTSSAPHHDRAPLAAGHRPARAVPLAVVAAVALPLRLRHFIDRPRATARQDIAHCRSHLAETFVSDPHPSVSCGRGRGPIDHEGVPRCRKDHLRIQKGAIA